VQIDDYHNDDNVQNVDKYENNGSEQEDNEEGEEMNIKN